MEVCAICLDDVDSKDMTQPYKCNHIFHKLVFKNYVNQTLKKI